MMAADSDFYDLQILTHIFDRSLTTVDLFDRIDLDKSGDIRCPRLGSQAARTLVPVCHAESLC